MLSPLRKTLTQNVCNKEVRTVLYSLPSYIWINLTYRPLHGIHILVKETIAVKDSLDVSAGLFALLGANLHCLKQSSKRNHLLLAIEEKRV